MFRGLEHPSGFPSMLRGATPEPRPLSRKDSHGSTHQLRRSDSTGLSRKDSSASTLNRRDSFGSNYLSRKDSNGSVLFRRDSNGIVLTRKDSNGSVLTRKDSNGSVLSRKDSPEFRPNKRDSLNEDFRRLSFGSSIYLRPDSTGATNLIRRDSFGRRDSAKPNRSARDYVSKIFEYKSDGVMNGNGIAPPEKETQSILRKSDDAQNKENFNTDLTQANLTKHVTIWEKDGDELATTENNGRRDSSGSLSSYLANRRISIDSLDVRRNSRRGSAASADINLSAINNEPEEVITLTL